MVTVYTVLFGDYVVRDPLRPPPPGDGSARYVCLTESAISVPGWDMWRVDHEDTNPRLRARRAKMRPDQWFGRDATTLWMDASCQLAVSPERMAVTAPVMGFQHPKRASVAAEGAVILLHGFAPADKVRAQLAAYAAAGFPLERAKLTTTGLLFRTPEAHAFNVLWEQQIETFTVRDQLSADYCAWATQTPIGHWAGSYLRNAYMTYHKHGPGPA